MKHTATNTDNWQEIEANCKSALPEKIVNFIEDCKTKPHSESQLISVLHMVQEQYGYLEDKKMNAVAQLMQIPVAQVTGVATFYHFFRLKPRGKYIINICLGTACYVKGADAVTNKIRDELGIDFGETSSDGVFTLEGSRCLGTCGLAPVIMINDEVHAKVSPDQVPILLSTYIEKAKAK